MNSEKKLIDENMLEALLYLSRLAPSSVDLKKSNGTNCRILGYFVAF